MRSREKTLRHSAPEKATTDSALPHVRIDWTEKELAHLAELVVSEPAKPTDGLTRLMKG